MIIFGRVKGLLLLLAVAMILVFFGGQDAALAASADDGFNPNANSYVWSLAVQADGKILWAENLRASADRHGTI